MRFKRLTIENFLAIGEATCSLDEKGLVLIQGDNQDDSSQDSNGSGKSAFADAISWVLYGVTARGESGDSIVNRTAKKNCRVSLTLVDGEDVYDVSRHRKHKGNKNRLIVHKIENHGDVQDLTKGTDKLTQAVLNKIIGCSEEVFTSAIYAGQEKMPDLPSMTDKQLKVLIEEAAGIARLQAAHVSAQAKYRDGQAALSQASSESINAELQMQEAKRYLDDVKKSIEAWEVERVENLKALSVKARECNVKLKEATEASRADADREAELLLEAKATNEKINQVDEEKRELAKLRESARQAEIHEVRLNDIKLSRKTDSLRAKNQLKSVRERVGKPCEECGKPHTEHDIASVQAIAVDKVKRAIELEKQATADYAAALDASSKLSEAYLNFEKGMTDISLEVAKSSSISAELNAIKQRALRVESAQSEFKQALSNIKAAKDATNPHHHYQERGVKALERWEGTHQRALKMKAEQETRVRLLEEVVRVFGASGVRSHILDTVTPMLNSRTSHYLSTLTDGNIQAVWSTLATTSKGELREKFNIEVSSLTGASSFNGLSGGEKRKVRLACSMALQDLVHSRASKPIGLYIADEIDHALDESGLERLMMLLDEKAKDKGTVLVISHNSLSDWIRQSVTVIKKEGFSHIQGSALGV